MIEFVLITVGIIAVGLALVAVHDKVEEWLRRG